MGVLRCFLALAVLVSHNAALPIATMPASTAVEIFFVISGFYMSLILRTKYADRAGAFYLNRALRLYPAYLFVILLNFAWFAAIWIYIGHRPADGISQYEADMQLWQRAAVAFSNVTMVGQDILRLLHYKIGDGFLFMHAPPVDVHGNYAGVAADGAKWIGEFQWMGQAWSLGAELWFYALAPWFIRVRSTALAVIAAFSFAIRWWMFQGDDSYFTYFFFPTNLGFFLTGMLLDRWSNIVALPLPAAPAAMIAIVPYTVLCATIFPGAAWPHYLLIALIPTLFLLTKNSWTDSELGNLSYPIYLCHTVIIAILVKIHLGNPYLAIVATLIVSAAIYRYIECPIDQIRQQIAKRDRGSIAPVLNLSRTAP
jgi:peptidoglycan/LPS O-acetylase OafA/YrhL